jgi:hypothetical protein
MKRDLYSQSKVSQMLLPKSRTATLQSSSVDMSGCRGLMIVADIGDTSDTYSATDKVELELQESDDNSTFTAVADADCINAISGATATGTFAKITNAAAGTGTQMTFTTEYLGNKRYVRVNARYSGTHTNGLEIGIVAVQHNCIKQVSQA